MAIELTRHTIDINGHERVFWAYWPEVPLRGAFLGCHGRGMRGRGFAQGGNRNFIQQAEEGYAGIFPNSGLNEAGVRAWALEGPLYEANRVFLHTLRQQLLDRGAPGVGLLGNSSGGYNTWKFRTDDPHRKQGQFAWYAPGAANLPSAWAARLLPAATFIPHSVADSLVPFTGSIGQLGWLRAVEAVATINSGGTPPTDAYRQRVKSCARSHTTFAVPYIGSPDPDENSTTAEVGADPHNWLAAAELQAKQMAPVIGAAVDPGNHSWHACGRWQMQQQVIRWANRLGLWVPNPGQSTTDSSGAPA